LRFERGLIGLDKGIKPDTGAAVGERDNRGIAGHRDFFGSDRSAPARR